MPSPPLFGRRASRQPAQPDPDPADPAIAKDRDVRPALILAGGFIGVFAATVLFLTETSLGQNLLDATGWFDQRPAENILIIGNSRTYYHDMPGMVRRMADSAHSPVRLAITMRAWGGASFEENWNDADVQKLLQQHWDYVILQSESRSVGNENTLASFSTYGQKLIAAAQHGGSPVALIVNWGYGETVFSNAPAGTRDAFISATEQSTDALAQQTGARLIDTCAMWERIHSAHPEFQLYEDGNHPTVAGSYISALMIYRFLSGADVEKVTYLPDGLDAQNADPIKSIVSHEY